MKSTGKSSSNSKAAGKSGHEARKDRQSVTGSPKKGGHGGKYTWSGDNADMRSDEFIVTVDCNDPNFEDPDVAVVEN